MDGAKRVTIRDTIKVSPKYLGNNIKTHIQQQLRKGYEDRCTLYGYVLPGSLEDVTVKHMAVEQATLRGYVNVSVECTAMAWNPPEKSSVLATVKTSNNFGILCTVDVSGREVMHIIIPKQIASIRSSKDLSSVKPGTKMEVMIMKRKMSMKADVLSAIGVVTSDAKLIQEEDRDRDDAMTVVSEGDTAQEGIGSEEGEYEDDAEDDALLAGELDDELQDDIDGDVEQDPATESEDDADADADADDDAADDNEGMDEEGDDVE